MSLLPCDAPQNLMLMPALPLAPIRQNLTLNSKMAVAWIESTERSSRILLLMLLSTIKMGQSVSTMIKWWDTAFLQRKSTICYHLHRKIFINPLSQQNSYSIGHLLVTVTTQWPDTDSIVTTDNCQQHSDYAASTADQLFGHCAASS